MKTRLSIVSLAILLLSSTALAQSALRARIGHGSALLPDGRVLVAGGESIDALYEWGAGTRLALLRSSAIYDPSSGSWSATGALSHPRTGLAAIALPDGRVVVLGGGLGQMHLDPSVEVWTPADHRFHAAGRLITARWGSTASLLSDGRIIVVGGANGDSASLSSVEIWDPATGQSTAASPLPIPLADHAAVVLADGRLLVTGGRTAVDAESSARSFVWDPATDHWIEAHAMSAGREDHSATLLSDGRVLVVGNRVGHRTTSCGWQEPEVCTRQPVEGDVAEIFDPHTLAFTATAPTHQPHLGGHRAVRLPDGGVAVFGMYEPEGTSHRVLEIWSPTTGAWEDWGDAALAGPNGMSATLLPDGRVLLVGATMEPNAQGALRASHSFDVWSGATAHRVTPARVSNVRRDVLE